MTHTLVHDGGQELEGHTSPLPLLLSCSAVPHGQRYIDRVALFRVALAPLHHCLAWRRCVVSQRQRLIVIRLQVFIQPSSLLTWFLLSHADCATSLNLLFTGCLFAFLFHDLI